MWDAAMFLTHLYTPPLSPTNRYNDLDTYNDDLMRALGTLKAAFVCVCVCVCVYVCVSERVSEYECVAV